METSQNISRPPAGRNLKRTTAAIMLALATGILQFGSPLKPVAAADKPENSPGKPVTIVAFGDSLTAGFGLPQKQAFPVVLAKALKARGENVTVINAGVSGDTTAAALARLDWAIPKKTDAVIVELGANDALRGLDPLAARNNLDRIMQKLTARNVEVLISGMMPPENYGRRYHEIFGTMYGNLARKYNALYDPFFLEGVAMKRQFNQSDGLHPNAKGVERIVERILPLVIKLVKRVKSRRLAKSAD